MFQDWTPITSKHAPSTYVKDTTDTEISHQIIRDEPEQLDKFLLFHTV